ncbi:hypothetical protein DPMN_190426 [Dreissena polymorpha]|uniref:Uncharacterized protein n=1 Tax=Dreissena polymorpha TaxID=45954 RepID=A0A9D4IAD4_DREPO|nr:hypothetical protein DPMN_190426 [Dreissena polymorpha]
MVCEYFRDGGMILQEAHDRKLHTRRTIVISIIRDPVIHTLHVLYVVSDPDVEGSNLLERVVGVCHEVLDKPGQAVLSQGWSLQRKTRIIPTHYNTLTTTTIANPKLVYTACNLLRHLFMDIHK